MAKLLKDVKNGEFFKIGKTIYKKDYYERSSKKYQVSKVNDIYGTGRLLKGSTKVDTDFTY